MSSRTRHQPVDVVRTVLAVASVVAIVVVLTRTWEEAVASLPSLSGIAVAAMACTGAMLMAWLAWASLLPSVAARTLAPGFHLAQLAKYIPGSVWQGVGQVLDAERFGVRRGTASVAFLVQVGTQAVAGALLGLAALVAAPPGWLAAVAVAGPLALVGLHRRTVRWMIATAASVAPGRFGHLADSVPRQTSIVRAAAAGVVTMVLLGVAFYALLAPGSVDVGFVGVAGVFALSWTLGFVAVPFPAGLGIRELVLVVGLGAGDATAPVLAAAVALRLVLLVVEVVLAVVMRWLPLASRPSRSGRRS